MKKRAVPPYQTIDTNLYNTLVALKENVDVLTGRAGGELKTLASTATTADIINKINEIIGRLNASG